MQNIIKHKAQSINVRTTVVLSDEIYNRLVELFGKRGISKALNELAAEHLFHSRLKRRSMSGTLEPFDLSDVKIGDEEFH